MYRKQRGLMELNIGIMIIVGAAFAGLWTFYYTQNSALKADVVAKQKVIVTLTTEKTEVLAEKTALVIANSAFQNELKILKEELASIKQERDDKTLIALSAKKAADQESLKFKKKIADILKTGLKDGENWCNKWTTMVMDYTLSRQTK